jgi:predicted RecA/RadA family phage recombinase
MNNFVKPGRTVTYTAPVGGVVSGAPVLIGSLVVVAAATVAAGLPFEGTAEGIFTLPKIAGVAWTEGAILYHDTTANNIGTVVSATTRRVGVAAAAAAIADTVGQVRLNGVGAPANVA